MYSITSPRLQIDLIQENKTKAERVIILDLMPLERIAYICWSVLQRDPRIRVTLSDPLLEQLGDSQNLILACLPYPRNDRSSRSSRITIQAKRGTGTKF